MKDIALQTARRSEGQTLNVLREYIQNDILGSLQKLGIHQRLYFVGGTALRFLYRIPRFSEDLDFCAGPNWKTNDFKSTMKDVASELRLAGYDLSLHLKSERTVQSASFRFPGILFDLGLSLRREQKLSISIEIDVRPPAGWVGERTIINIFRPILIQHYDMKSLFTTKIAAVLTRDYIKGRDYFDLFWYLSSRKELTPQMELLKNALAQKPDRAVSFKPARWKAGLSAVVSSLNWKAVVRDVLPFLERTDDIHAFTQENLLLLLAHR